MRASESAGETRRCRMLLGAGALIAACLGRSGKGLAKEADVEAESSGYAMVDGRGVYHEVHGGPANEGRTPIVLPHGGVMSIDTAFGDDLIARFVRTRPVIAIEQQGAWAA
jgi:hypothetical protein